MGAKSGMQRLAMAIRWLSWAWIALVALVFAALNFLGIPGPFPAGGLLNFVGASLPGAAGLLLAYIIVRRSPQHLPPPVTGTPPGPLTIHPPWEIRSSPIHGAGLFARTDLPAGLRWIEYVGRKIAKHESLALYQQNNPYIFSLGDDWDLDGNSKENPARFINHSCNPNCQAEQDGDRIWITSLRPIRAGEELTYDYGYDLQNHHEHPCRCNSPDCPGFIVAKALRPILAKSSTRPPGS
jgi:uncharacterized protein